MRMSNLGARLSCMGKVTMTGLAVAVLLPALAVPASAIPGYDVVNYQCRDVEGLLESSSLDRPDATRRWATWGVSTNVGGRGLPYGNSQIQILSLTTPDGSVEVFTGEPADRRTKKSNKKRATPAQQVTECTSAYSGRVAKIALISPPPAAPPAYVSGGRYAPQAEAGRYAGWVIRSEPYPRPDTGCVLASPPNQTDIAELRQFCFNGRPNPSLWDVVDIDYRPGQVSDVTIIGTFTSFRRPQ